MEELLSKKEATAFLGCSGPTLTRRAAEYNIPTLRFPLGRTKIFYRKHELEKLLIPTVRDAV